MSWGDCQLLVRTRPARPGMSFVGVAPSVAPGPQHDTGHRDALVLVTGIGPSTGEGTAPCPAQTPPPNPTAAEPDGSPFWQGSA